MVATGNLDQAEARLAATLEGTEKAAMPHWHALALQARARLHAARGDLDAARRDLDAAMATFSDLGSGPELERAASLRRALLS